MLKRRRNLQCKFESLEPRRVLDSTIVFNEIMYHPRNGEDGVEWIELHNQMAVNMDVSNWTIDGGVRFEFPNNTTIPGGAYAIVASDPEKLPVATDLIFGPFEGRISNGGEHLRLMNRSDRIMDSIDFDDANPWPVAPDGSGATLAKKNAQSGSANPENWSSSELIGGTPGESNFPADDSILSVSALVRPDAKWKFDTSGDDLGTAWREPGFNDAGWQSGDAVLFAGTFQNIKPPTNSSVDATANSILVKNPSFELNTNGGVGYGEIDDWNTSGQTGINPASDGAAPFVDNGAIPDRRRVAFIQGRGSISQRLTGLDRSHEYWLQLHYNARSCCGGTPAIAINFAGLELLAATPVEPVGATEPFHFVNIPFKPHVRAGTLTINNIGSAGDHSLLLDAVNVVSRNDMDLILQNPSFEASGNVTSDPGIIREPVAGWTFAGSGVYGVSDDDDAFHDNGLVPDGAQSLFIQGQGSIRQTLHDLIPGQRYEVSFRHNAKTGVSPQLQALIAGERKATFDGRAVGDGQPYSADAVRFTAVSETTEVRFEQSVDDGVVFLDDMRLRKLESPLVTEVSSRATTSYFRHAFDFDGNPSKTDLVLKTFVDDGAIVYLNGVEVLRQNLPNGQVTATTRASRSIGDPEFTDEMRISSGPLIQGTNVLAVEVHQAALNDADMAFALELAASELAVDPSIEKAKVAINEIGSAGEGFAIEIFNFGEATVDLSGLALSIADQDKTFANQTLPPGEFLTIPVSERRVESGDRVFLLDSVNHLVLDAIDVADLGKARRTDGSGDWFHVSTSTFDAANQVNVNDAVVINEIMYHHLPTYAVPEEIQTAEPISFNGQWKYLGDDVAPDASWVRPEFSDDDWQTGETILHAGEIDIDFTGALPAGVGIESVSVKNHGFEDGELPPSPGYGPIEGWTSGGGTGINTRTGPFNNSLRVPEGRRVAFLQGAQTISQTLTGFVPGKAYTVSYQENERGAPPNFAKPYVSLGGTMVVPEREIAHADRYRRVISDPFVATSSSHVLRLGNAQVINDPSEDNTALFDRVVVTRAAPRIANANFEDLVISDRGFRLAPNEQLNVGWSFAGSAGISRNGSVIQAGSRSDEGNQLGFLQGQSSITQTVSGFEKGVTYSLTWAERIRRGAAANDLEIVLDLGLPTEQIIAAKHVVEQTSFEAVTSQQFIANKSSYSLTLRSSNPNGGDGDAVLIDDLRLHFVSEPQSLGTELPSGVRTHYFRQPFEFDYDPRQTELALQLLVDDGAVVFLNGSEVYRHNMPEGVVNHATTAQEDLAQSEFTANVAISAASLRWGPNVLAIEMHQATGSDDIAFGAVLSATISSPGSTFADSDEEWIELYNRSSDFVDLSGWRLEDAIDFTFDDATSLGPDEFLVIAKNPQSLAQKFPDARILGGFAGKLANDHESIMLRDDIGNPVDSVHYFDGGRWPHWPDGGGSSLELKNPETDNHIPESWAASRDEDKSTWREYSYRGIGLEPDGLNTPAYFDEVILGLLDAGEILIDDFRVVEDPDNRAVDRMQNGAFETDSTGDAPTSWRIVGNHRGVVIVDPDDPENRVLRLTANGPMEHMSNHAEVTFANGAEIQEGAAYEISFRAKWLRGSPQLNTRLYFDQAAKTTILRTQDRSGTPGTKNSTYVSQSGPTFSGLSHSPAVPTPDEPVTVSISADDPQDVEQLNLHYSVNGDDFDLLTMELSAGGTYQAIIPSQRNNAVVQFYVTAQDRLGAESRFPADGEDSRALYRVDRPIQNDQVHSLRIIMTRDDTSLLHTNSNVMSNDRLGATVIYNDEEIFYDVGVRLRASGYGRQGGLAGFNIQFDPAHLFRGVHQTVALDRGAVFSNGNGTGGVQGRSGASPHELMIYQTALHAGGIAGMYDDVVFVDAPRSGNTGLALLKMARYSDVFLDSQFDNGGEGSLFKFELIYHATTTVDGNPESLKRAPNAVIGTDISDLGPDKEPYRWNMIAKNNRDRDDYDAIVQLGQAFSLRGDELDAASAEIMDVDQWMRTFALLSLVGVADAYNMGLAHNLEVYVRPTDGKVLAFPWDVDHGFFYSSNSPLLGRGGSNLQKVINLPQNRRLFYKHLLDIVETAYNVEYLTPWAEHYAAMTGYDVADFFVNYVGGRSRYVLNQLDRVAPPTAFEIKTNAGNPVTIDATVVTLEGQGWIDVHQIRLAGETEPLDVVWKDQQTWSITIPAAAGVNEIQIEAFDFRDRPVGTDSIQVTSTVVARPLSDHLRITEIMYNPPDPSPAELEIDSGWENDDFEFLELMNTSETQALDVSSLRFTNGPSQIFEFETADVQMIAPGETILLVSNLQAFQARYDVGLPVAGEYAGRLSNGGERITLEDSIGTAIIDFEYDDSAPWPQAADGDGVSLELIDPSSTSANQHGEPQRWRASFSTGGNPGIPPDSTIGDFNGDGLLSADDIDALCGADSNNLRFDLNSDGKVSDDDHTFLIEKVFQTSFGDANLDGVFDSRDLVKIFQAGQYGDSIEGNSTWETGDWNCDGEFDSSDLVVAFQAGDYTGQSISRSR